MIYGYDLVEGTRFEMSIKELCRIQNCENGLNDNCYIFTSIEDREFHFLSNCLEIELEESESNNDILNKWYYFL